MAFAPRNNVNGENGVHPSRSTNNWRFGTRAEAPASLPARRNLSTSPPKVKTESNNNSSSSENVIQAHIHDRRERKIMPKDFLQPMTCFYWATQGRCTKTADECFYAHWDTGVIASGPVSMARDGQSVTVAGRHADAQTADFIARENSLKTRELALNSRQVLLNQHDAALNARCANMKTAMQEVYDTIETFDNESAEALRALHRRKKQIEEFNVATAAC
ncbi:hypothetical protein B0A49_01003 [Cryomyces minteri]|uniref:C3H1-type domain-containing protein n=1 Tax=Cryomyces minteri TaxID=331657 RepID=A0A4U0XSB3_9PEZI|nr:hypothetical protein B0A49_01003 [Cryomyces minteri]